jgi:hypothetical protein
MRWYQCVAYFFGGASSRTRSPASVTGLGAPLSESVSRQRQEKALVTATKEPSHRQSGSSSDQPSIRRAASAAFMPIVTPLARAGSLAVETMPSR